MCITWIASMSTAAPSPCHNSASPIRATARWLMSFNATLAPSGCLPSITTAAGRKTEMEKTPPFWTGGSSQKSVLSCQKMPQISPGSPRAGAREICRFFLLRDFLGFCFWVRGHTQSRSKCRAPGPPQARALSGFFVERTGQSPGQLTLPKRTEWAEACSGERRFGRLGEGSLFHLAPKKKNAFQGPPGSCRVLWARHHLY